MLQALTHRVAANTALYWMLLQPVGHAQKPVLRLTLCPDTEIKRKEFSWKGGWRVLLSWVVAMSFCRQHGHHDVTNHLSGTSLTKGMIINQCGITDTRDLFPSFGIRTKDRIVRSMDDVDPTTTTTTIRLLLLLFQ